MSEGPKKMRTALEIANERADKLRAEDAQQQDAIMPSALDVASARADTVVEKLRVEEEKAQQSTPATETEATEIAPAAESPAEKKDPFDIPQQGAEGNPAENYFADRSEELNKKAGGYGVWAEKRFRSLGERYNKLGWKSKLAIGVGFGLGAAAFSGVSMPLTLAFTGGIFVQRAAGWASMYMKFEKHLQDTSERTSSGFLGKREWYQKLFKGRSEGQRKAIAFAMAAAYTGGVSYAIKEAVYAASESAYGEAVHEWLKHHYPFGSAETIAPVAGTTMPHAEAPSPIPEAAAPEIPDVSVDASDGHGYEYMMKRMWEQLQEKGLDADQYPEGSDIRQLLEANKDTVDGVVHRLAADQDHSFFNADGTSVQIDPGAHMTIDADGNITIGDAMHDTAMHAPEGATTTPAYHAEASVEGGGDSSVPGGEGGNIETSQESGAAPEDDHTPKEAREKLKKMINDFFNEKEPSPDTRVHSSIQIPTDEAVATPDTVSPDTSGAFYNAQPQPPIEDHATTAPPQPEASHAPAPETSHFVVNAHGLSVDPDHANAYLDTQGNHIIYGGSLDDRAEIAKQLIAKDHSAMVFFDSTRSEKFLGLFERKVSHLSVAHWVDAGGESGVQIAEDTPDASLIGIMRPNINDLAQAYKPTN